MYDDANFGTLMEKAGVTRAQAYTDAEICNQLGAGVEGTHAKRMLVDEALKNPCRIGHYPVFHGLDDSDLLQTVSN